MLVNGHIYTMDPEHPWASAVAIRGEAIIAVNYSQAPPPTPAPGGGAHGDSNELKNFRGRNTRVIDLRGQLAIPGFNDAHLHLAEAAYGKNDVNLVATSSLADFEQRIRVTLSFYKPGEWIVGRGWDHTLWPHKAAPHERRPRLRIHRESDLCGTHRRARCRREFPRAANRRHQRENARSARRPH